MSRPRLGLLGDRSPTSSLVGRVLTAQEEVRIVTTSLEVSTRIETATARSDYRRRHAVVAALLALATFLASPSEGQFPKGEQFQVNVSTTDDQGESVVAAYDNGEFVVVWAGPGLPGQGGEIFGRRFASDGQALGDDFLVNTYTTSSQFTPAIGANAGGGFVVTWRSYGSAGDDNLQSSVQARRYDLDGVPVGAQFQVNTYTPGSQNYAAVGPAGTGFIVTWASSSSSGDNDWSIQARLYDADGAPLGDEFQVNTTTNEAQFLPEIGPAADGFVIAWLSEASPGTDTDESILAQRFTPDGMPLGSEFQVNTYTTERQDYPRIAAHGSDGFVVVWASRGSEGNDTDGSSIQAQRYAADGVPLGGQFQVNTFTTDSQARASVISDPDGGFVVVWTSSGS